MLDALTHIAGSMTLYIKGGPGNRVVENPVNPSENFADRWKPDNNKEKNFYDWIAKLQADINRIHLSAGNGQDKIKALFDEIFGEKVAKASFSAYADYVAKQRNDGRLTASAVAGTLGTSTGATVPKHNFYGKHE